MQHNTNGFPGARGADSGFGGISDQADQASNDWLRIPALLSRSSFFNRISPKTRRISFCEVPLWRLPSNICAYVVHDISADMLRCRLCCLDS